MRGEDKTYTDATHGNTPTGEDCDDTIETPPLGKTPTSCGAKLEHIEIFI